MYLVCIISFNHVFSKMDNTPLGKLQSKVDDIGENISEGDYLLLNENMRDIYRETNALQTQNTRLSVENLRLLHRTRELEEETRKKPRYSPPERTVYTIEDVNRNEHLLNDDFFFVYASDEVKSNFDIMMKLVKKNPRNLKNASEELRNNFELVMAAVQAIDRFCYLYEPWQFDELYGPIFRPHPRYRDNFVNALQFASPSLQDNFQIVMASVKKEWRSLQFASSNMRNNREIVMEALRGCGSALEFASPELQKDQEVVKEALRGCGSALEFASPELQNDQEVVLAAVKDEPEALQYASEDMRNNEDIVMTALIKSRFAFHVTPYKFRKDREFAINLLSHPTVCSKDYFPFFERDVIKDKEVLKTLIENKPEIMRDVKYWQSVRNDREFQLQLVSQNGLILQYMIKDMKADKEVVKIAISQNKAAFEYASKELKEDSELIAMSGRKD